LLVPSSAIDTDGAAGMIAGRRVCTTDEEKLI
jgi:hypothetical protein